jgi:hypothetical protein
MYRIDTQAVERFIQDTFGLSCVVQTLEAPETRFTLKITSEDLSFNVAASDARICIVINVNELGPVAQTAILVQLKFIKETIERDLSPYKLTLWKDDEKTYAFVPDLEKLKSNSKFSIDICTPPCDISDIGKAELELKSLLQKAFEWLLSARSGIGEQEGERDNSLASKVERSAKNRALCIAINGYDCQVCGLKMDSKYGSLAEGFIHVHHIESIAAAGPRWIDPSRDLITVCPNCHAMLHRRNPPLLPQELRNIIEGLMNE